MSSLSWLSSHNNERASKSISVLAALGLMVCVSDASGEPIPKARLEVMPEAICTVAEEAAHERGL